MMKDYIFRMENTNYCSPPSVSEILKYDLWELHEAAFFLTEWPKYLVKTRCIDHELSRDFFYEAAPPPDEPNKLGWEFSSTSVSGKFGCLHRDLINSVHKGSIQARIQNVGLYSYGWKSREIASYLVSPDAVLQWALFKGITIPEEAQDAIGVRVFSHKKIPYQKICTKIVAQHLRTFFPGETDVFYLNHPWMKEFGTCSPSPLGNRAILKSLEILKKSKDESKQGRRSKSEITSDEYYQPKPIEEVVTTIQGRNHFNIPAFRVVMQTSANILASEYLENTYPTLDNPGREDLIKFLDDFLNNEVVQMYLENSPRQFKEIASHTAFQYVSGVFFLEEGK